MRVGEPIHAIKFVMKVGEEHLQEAISTLQTSVAPVLKESGFREVLVLARRRELEKIDPDGPGIADSSVLRDLVRNARPHEAGREQILRKLTSRPGGHRPGSVGGAYQLRNMAKNNPAAYDRLLANRLAEERRLVEKLLDERNMLRVVGRELDCYALYGSEADLKDDTLDLENRRMGVPHSASLLAGELEGVLFLGMTGVFHTIVHRLSLEEVSRNHRGSPLLVAQTRMAVLPEHLREAESRIRASLLPRLASPIGAVGALALRSRREGFSGGRVWYPQSLFEHDGGPPPGTALQPRWAPIPHEIVTFWRTEPDLIAGVEWLAEHVPEMLGDLLGSRGLPAGNALGEGGELVLQA
ncbi:MAG: hypothetical protein M3Q49_20655 [Actinomycetota bacterium]|nr:hypothetical protein [Actinomycetota bacterium]